MLLVLVRAAYPGATRPAQAVQRLPGERGEVVSWSTGQAGVFRGCAVVQLTNGCCVATILQQANSQIY